MRSKVTLLCRVCGSQFLRDPCEARGTSYFCGLKCLGISRRVPVREALFARVQKNDEGCWGWTGMVTRYGYGRLNTHKQKGQTTILAHRTSWEIHFGPIPDDMCVCHKCDNRTCTRPDHLFLGTITENMADMVSKGRQAKGENHGHAKLTWDSVAKIRATYAEGEKTIKELAKDHGVCVMSISLIVNNKTWRKP